MNYSIAVSIYNQSIVNPNEKDKEGNPVPPKYVLTLGSSLGFNLTTPTKEGTFTAAEIKAKVKQEMSLPDSIIDVKLTAKGKDLNDNNPVTSYGANYVATLPYVAPTPPPRTEGPTGSTGTTGTTESTGTTGGI